MRSKLLSNKNSCYSISSLIIWIITSSIIIFSYFLLNTYLKKKNRCLTECKVDRKNMLEHFDKKEILEFEKIITNSRIGLLTHYTSRIFGWFTVTLAMFSSFIGLRGYRDFIFISKQINLYLFILDLRIALLALIVATCIFSFTKYLYCARFLTIMTKNNVDIVEYRDDPNRRSVFQILDDKVRDKLLSNLLVRALAGPKLKNGLVILLYSCVFYLVFSYY